MRNLTAVLCILCVLLYGYFSLLPKRFIIRNTAQIVLDAEHSMDENASQVFNDGNVHFETPRLEAGCSTLSKLVFSVPVVSEDHSRPKYLIYITLSTEEGDDIRSLFRWKLDHISFDV